MSAAHEPQPEPRGPILLAGRTATVEWASLLLRRAGREVHLLERTGEAVTVRAAWSEDGGGAAESFASIADALASSRRLGAARRLRRLRGLAGWRAAGRGCPVPPS